VEKAWILVCCAALSIVACKKTDETTENPVVAAEGATDDATEAAGDVVVGKTVTPVEVDTTAPPNIGVIPEDARKSESGLAWVVTEKGSGVEHPSDTDLAIINFIGWAEDGKLIDESLTSGRPAAVPVEHMFPGMSEGVKSMVAGEKRRLWIPKEIGFAKAETGDPAGAAEAPKGMVVYDVELLRFTPLPVEPEPTE